MTNLGEQQDIRAKFYSNPAVIKHIKIHGVPRSRKEFRNMVVAGSSEELDSKEGMELTACLGDVVFRMHTQQINVMDKSNGKTIATLAL